MKKYIVSFLIALTFLVGVPFITPTASAADISIRDFINMLIAVGVITPDKMPAINAYLNTLNDNQGGNAVYPVCGSATWSIPNNLQAPTSNLCSVGTLASNSGSTSDGRWYWGCVGSNTGWKDNNNQPTDTAWCFAPKAPPTSSCIAEGGSLGAVVPGNTAVCCPGLTAYAPPGIVGTRGTCQKPNYNSINVVTPNGGEVLKIGDTYDIKWNGYPSCAPGSSCPNLSSTSFDIKLVPITPPNPPCTGTVCAVTASRAPYYLAKDFKSYIPHYSWVVGRILDSNIITPIGPYNLSVCFHDTDNCDTSDKTFSIVSQSQQPSITVLSPNGDTFVANGTYRIRWNASSGIATIRLADYLVNSVNSGYFAQGIPASQGYFDFTTGPSPVIGNYILVLEGLNANNNVVATAQTTFTVQSGSIQPPTPVYPTCGSATNVASVQMPTSNLCSVGTLHARSGTANVRSGATGDDISRWYWGCVGSNTGWAEDTAWCFAPKVTPITTVSCSASPTSPNVGQSVSWAVRVVGGTNSYNFNWSGDVSGTSPIVTTSYSTSGYKNASVRVTDSNGSTLSAECTTSVQAPPVPVYPVCGTNKDVCTVGRLGSTGSTGDGTNRWFWACIGQNTGWTDDTAWCFAPKTTSVVNGQNSATALIGWNSFLQILKALE